MAKHKELLKEILARVDLSDLPESIRGQALDAIAEIGGCAFCGRAATSLCDFVLGGEIDKTHTKWPAFKRGAEVDGESEGVMPKPKHKTVTRYMHLLNREPANYKVDHDGAMIYYATIYDPVVLCNSLSQLRREQRAYFKARTTAPDDCLSYIRVRVEEPTNA